MYIIIVLATLTNKNYHGQKEVTVNRAKKHQKNWGFLVKLKTPLTSEPSWPVFECFLLLRWWFGTNQWSWGKIRGTLGTGRRVGFLSQEVARPETPKEARVRATKNQTVTISNIFQQKKLQCYSDAEFLPFSCPSTIPNKAIYFFLPLGLALGLASCFGKSLRRNMMAFRSIPVLP